MVRQQAHSERHYQRRWLGEDMGLKFNRRVAACMLVAASFSLLGASAVPAAEQDEPVARERVRIGAGLEVLSSAEAQSFGLPAVTAGEQWVKISEKPRTETAFDPNLGTMVTAPGISREFALAPRSIGRLNLASAASVVAAAGCTVKTHHAPVHRTYYSFLHKYGPRAYAHGEMSAGCNYITVVSVVMREDHGLYTPEVASAKVTARPGQGRKTAYAYYSGLGKCETYWSRAFGWNSEKVRVCP